MTGQTERDWTHIARNPKFVELHRRKVTFLFGWWVISTAVYLVLLIGAGVAPKLFAWRILGDMNFAYVFVISLFIYCWAVAGYYAFWANRVSDKLTAELVKEFSKSGVNK